ncbi:MAG: PSD1 domain-containing protein, partial [Planctomycetales bacterium]|nr:PSD1 domain-containing protein [Planctomycetales bacterium]
MVVFTLCTSVVQLHAAEPQVDFNQQVRPLLSNRCFRCHGPDAADRQGGGEGGLRLDTATGAGEDLGGYRAIVAGDPDASELITRITHDDPDLRMPPTDHGAKLSEQEVALLRRWIQQGAHYKAHWSYQPLSRPTLPTVQHKSWPRTAYDHFTLAAMEQRRLQPQETADRATLARRVALDLTGLPPSIEEAQRFLNDSRPDAYEQLVDRLLSSPEFGEHWARMWLDLARYADSSGYADDPPRKIWLYRDYVIQALNDDKPFDQFTIEQLAGDLLPSPSNEQLIATAFHRNTLTNNEGGTNDEEFRNVAIVDRVNTTMAVWMGTTMACAQCHSHKYDPITQQDYFRFFAILNNTADADRGDESPVLELYTQEQQAARATLSQTIERLQAQEQTESVAAELKATQEQLQAIKPNTVPIQRELGDDQRRVTKIQRRGNYLDVTEEVSPGLPAAFHPLDPADQPNRLGLAHWLVAPDNPLTARVMANRCWEQLFGAGLVSTSEDFGSQGELPSHPELLDWMASDLVGSGWDLKALLRRLVLSATYRQTSRIDAEQAGQDTENRWLARGPRFRMTGEMAR